MKFVVLSLLFSFAVAAQKQPDIKVAETELARLGQNCIRLKTEEQRLAAQDSFAVLLDELIGTEESFGYDFARVTNLSKLLPEDKSFRVYTWSVPMRDGSFSFFGRLVLKNSTGFKVINLQDGASTLENPENMLLKTEQWYGAMYYGIITTKEKHETFYTLMGYRPNNSTHNEKLLDVLSLKSLNTIRFGAKIFNTPFLNGIKYKRQPYRLIFRYSPKSVASVKYIESEQRIVMDHLAPADVSTNDDWARYGPDFSYQALFWKDGQWQLEDEIEVKNNIAPTSPQPTEQGLPKK